MTDKKILLERTWTCETTFGAVDQFLFYGERLVALSGRKIHAIDIYTGEEIDNGHFPYECQYSGENFLTAAAGTLFFLDGRSGDQLKAVNLVDGREKSGWNWDIQQLLRPGDPARASIHVKALTAVDDVVIVIYTVGFFPQVRVCAFYTSDGSKAWPEEPCNIGTESIGPVAAGEDAVFFVMGGQLYAVNTDFGDQRFPQEGQEDRDLDLTQEQPPLVGQKVAVCTGHRVYGFDIDSGEQKWVFPGKSGDANVTWQIALSEDKNVVVALSSTGTLYALDTAAGTKKWEADNIPAELPGGLFFAAGSDVYLANKDYPYLYVFDLESGQEKVQYDLGQDVSKTAPLIGNGTIFIQTGDGNFIAKAYAQQDAAYFNGKDTYIDIEADQSQFDFGTGDFTIEAWVRSCQGGEILSSYGEDSVPSHCRFRFNLSREGELRFAVLSQDNKDQELARSVSTNAADGYWHHVAVARYRGDVRMFVDGISADPASLIKQDNLPVYANGKPYNADGFPFSDSLTPAPPPPLLDISGQKGLTIGAVKESAASIQESFEGLLREVRIWDTALDVDSIQSRMKKVLGPAGVDGTQGTVKDKDGKVVNAPEPRLLGNWHLDQDFKADKNARVENDVLGHEFAAVPQNLSSGVTDLTLDMSAFPYLLDPVKLQWPYSGHWTARGEHPLTTPAALSDNGILCFGTDNYLYAVDRAAGRRQWVVAVTEGCSPATAYGSRFYVVSGQEGLVSIDAQTGSFRSVPGFESLLQQAPGKGETLTAPAVDLNYIAAASPDGRVLVKDRQANDSAMEFKTGGNPRSLTLADGKVYAYSAADRKLYVIDPAANSSESLAVDSQVVYARGNRLFCITGGKLALIDASKGLTPAYQAQSISDAAGITGLAAAPDANLLVVTTNNGIVYGLSFASLSLRWQVQVPPGSSGQRNSLNAPFIDGFNVYCTGRSGTVTVIDGRNGQMRGLFYEETAVITPALADSGEVFFGCAENAPGKPLDGALHSVVFGQNYALRLGLNHGSMPTRNGGYALIEEQKLDAGQKRALERLLETESCCIETWINQKGQTGGDLVSMCPSSGNEYGLRLYLDGQNKVHFIAYKAQDNDKWNSFGAFTDAVVPREEWAHVAVSVKSETDIRIYINGEQQDTTLIAPAAVTPAAVVPGLKIYLGADATAAGNAPGNFFHGLMDDVRIWDEYQLAAQVSRRMHTRLRGNEADLAAYWNFDTIGVHDSSRKGLNGSTRGHAAFWLTNLTFEQPTYPYLTTRAKITQVGEGSGQGQSTDTIYELTISAYKADGSALAGQELDLWYVKHPDENEPDTIELTCWDQKKTLNCVPPDHEMLSQDCFTVKTAETGKALVYVATGDLDHGPSLDLHAGFMPSHERFHINVLLDNQKLAKPAPPKLTVQAKLLQDYHWSTGSKIDSSRSRETYRAVIIAENADSTPLSGERITLWANEPAEVEVDGKKYPVNQHNYQSFLTDANGELTVVLTADSLKAPDLYVRAGFMHRDDRVIVHPDQDAHNQLADVQGNDMKNSDRMINWKPDSEGGPEKGSLLKGDYRDHADEISGGMRHLMAGSRSSSSSGTSGNPGASKAKSNPGQLLGFAGGSASTGVDTSFADMRQAPPPPREDVIHTMRTLKHIKRRTVITPEHVLDSLKEAAAQQGVREPVGFYLTMDSDRQAVTLGYFDSRDARQHMGQTTVPGAQEAVQKDILLGGFFSDLWHDVKYVAHKVEDAAEDIGKDIEKIAVKVGKAITVAIHYVDKVCHMVLKSIEDALVAVATFLEKIALAIIDVIKFLMMLFHWGDIVETHNVIRETMSDSLEKAIEILKSKKGGAQDLNALVKRILGNKLDFGEMSPSAGSMADMHSSHSGNPAVSHSNSVQGKYMHSKAKQHSSSARMSGAPGKIQSEPQIEGDISPTDILDELKPIFSEISSLSLNDLGPMLMDIIKRIVEGVLDTVTLAVEKAVDVLVVVLEGIVKVLEFEFKIPFISALYEWITGHKLTIMDLLALIIAIPVYIVYAIITQLVYGSSRTFNGDFARSLLTSQTDTKLGMAEKSEVLLGAAREQYPWAMGNNMGVEVSYVVFRVFYAISSFIREGMFIELVDENLDPDVEKTLNFFKVLTGVFHMVSQSLLFWCITPEYVNTAADKLNKDKVDLELPLLGIDLVQFYVYFSVISYVSGTIVNDLYGVSTGIIALDDPAMETDQIDKRTTQFKAILGVISLILAAYRIYITYTRPEHKASDEKFRMRAELLGWRDVLMSFESSMSFTFTYTCGKLLGPEGLTPILGLRTLMQILEIVLHSIAEFDFKDW